MLFCVKIYSLFLKIFKSEFLIQVLIFRLTVSEIVITIYQHLSLGVKNHRQIKFWKLKLWLLFYGSLNILRFSLLTRYREYNKIFSSNEQSTTVHVTYDSLLTHLAFYLFPITHFVGSFLCLLPSTSTLGFPLMSPSAFVTHDKHFSKTWYLIFLEMDSYIYMSSSIFQSTKGVKRMLAPVFKILLNNDTGFLLWQ